MKKSSLANRVLILFSVFSIAICCLIYELLFGTISSYLLGDSIYQFSIVIGLFMSSMGLGSFLSRYINRDLPFMFVFIEIVIGLAGGFSTIILFFAFSHIDNYSVFLFLITCLIGTLVGFEIPLIIRILKDYYTIKMNVSNVLTADYAGALIGAILFPLVLVPKLGLIKTGLFFGIVNIAAGYTGIYVFKDFISNRKLLSHMAGFGMTLLVIAFSQSSNLISFFETNLYKDEIIFAKDTKYQRIVLTKRNKDVLMYLNGGLQFNSKDEYRYHESIVHPVMSHLRNKSTILVLGGGDGLACRELLKYEDVKQITLVDLDKDVTDLFQNNKNLRKINSDSLNNPKVVVKNEDAWKFLEKSSELYNLVIIDLPDPHSVELSKLYTQTFYQLVLKHLSLDGAFITQSTSPLFSRKAYWCIQNTIASLKNPFDDRLELSVQPFHVYVPSFGEWGFIMASPVKIKWKEFKLTQKELRFINDKELQAMITFPDDMKHIETEINTLNTHKILQYYEEGWSEWFS